MKQAILGLLLVGLAVGCGGGSGDRPETGPVAGKVTLDGQPLADATVTFSPDSGRPSSGVTNANGEYELDYTVDVKGAKVGSHKVSISTFKAGDAEGEGSESQAVPEKVPPQYNRETTLTFEVKPEGHTDANFDLQSK